MKNTCKSNVNVHEWNFITTLTQTHLFTYSLWWILLKEQKSWKALGWLRHTHKTKTLMIWAFTENLLICCIEFTHSYPIFTRATPPPMFLKKFKKFFFSFPPKEHEGCLPMEKLMPCPLDDLNPWLTVPVTRWCSWRKYTGCPSAKAGLCTQLVIYLDCIIGWVSHYEFVQASWIIKRDFCFYF